MKLEQLTKGTRARGLSVEGIATVKSVEFRGANAMEVIFTDPKGALHTASSPESGRGSHDDHALEEGAGSRCQRRD